uniref:Uncharacterized protein YjbI, contains pentapeptide repeats n=1 Tax=Candidatus Kentrum eta TaxID=2126337 RepID=A0A450UDJ0_9GAMM|nr:MAG: Uncharacterized protein YjbI, contains pentapeptide repeats [Candidatus Kentron sp. H]VFJ91676.1 MAG: Uncharacterized protein YjbI, contains pentapeptide repeats [Candidatus Kentron sp. H]VFJ98277.1 MAG: Uncharacterized protein YjbI, contains pentapeptide repeats [Candidatus Kentron sp. H]
MKKSPDRCEAAPESRLAALQKAGWGLLLSALAGLRLLYLHLTPWGLYNFSGLRHIVEMHWPRRPNASDYEKPPTLVLWFIGIYVALYGIAATYYESSLDRVENRMGALASQLATTNDEALKQLIERIARIQRMEMPREPSLLWPFEGNFALTTFFLGKQRNPEIVQWTKEILEDWKGSLAGKVLVRVDLSRARLQEADLSGAGLWKANLSRAELWGADLPEARLNEANLSGAKLQQADLSRARLQRADLSGAELPKADLPEAQLNGADLSGAGLEEADLSGAGLLDADLSGAGLWKANLSGAWLQGADFSGAWFGGADLSGARLLGANLSGANLGDIENWQAIESIDDANIIGVKNTPRGFREWALKNGAVELEPAAWEAFRKKPK